MSLKKQLAQLKRERSLELRRAAGLCGEVRQEISETLSPMRFIQEHPGISLSAAFAVGLLLAPAPRYQRAGRNRARPHRVVALLARLLPQPYRGLLRPKASLEEDAEEDDRRRYDRPRSLLASLLLEALPLVARAVDWPRMLRSFMGGMGKGKVAEEGGAPSVAVADAGTQPADAPFAVGHNGHHAAS